MKNFSFLTRNIVTILGYYKNKPQYYVSENLHLFSSHFFPLIKTAKKEKTKCSQTEITEMTCLL